MSGALGDLEARIEAFFATPAGEGLSEEAAESVEDLLQKLESGELRAATHGKDGTWSAVPWVKRGILTAFRLGVVVPMAGTEGGAPIGNDASSPTV